jgi:hypothetical protein
MIIIKPNEVTDSNLVSSIPSVDPYTNEGEWFDRPWLFRAVPSGTLQFISCDEATGKFYTTNTTANGEVYIYDRFFNLLDTITLIDTENATDLTTVNGMTFFNGSIYVVKESELFIFDLQGNYIYSRWVGNWGTAQALGHNGYYIITAYGGATPFYLSNDPVTLLSNPNITQNVQMQPGASNREFRGVCIGPNGCYFNDFANGEMLDVETRTWMQEPIINFIPKIALSLSRGIATYKGVFYSGDTYRVEQTDISGNTIGGYPIGFEANYNNSVYVANANTRDNPSVGELKDPQTWSKKYPTNKFAMFDSSISTRSLATSSITQTITFSGVISGIAGFGISGAELVNITVNASGFGEVYNKNIDMNDPSPVIDAWTYYFSPIINRDRFVVLDIPPFTNTTTTITITGSGEIGVGSLVIGKQVRLGVANYNTAIELLDFSTQRRSIFGEFEIVKRGTADLVDFDVTINKNNVSYVRAQLKEISQVPVVWIGDETAEDDATLTLGYYEKFRNNISSPTITNSTIKVNGLA